MTNKDVTLSLADLSRVVLLHMQQWPLAGMLVGAALQQPGPCLFTRLACHSGELFSQGGISAAAPCLWGTGVAFHVAQAFSLSTNMLLKRVCGWGEGGEFWSSGVIKLSFSLDTTLSIKPSLWNRTDVLYTTVFLTEKMGWEGYSSPLGGEGCGRSLCVLSPQTRIPEHQLC